MQPARDFSTHCRFVIYDEKINYLQVYTYSDTLSIPLKVSYFVEYVVQIAYDIMSICKYSATCLWFYYRNKRQQLKRIINPAIIHVTSMEGILKAHNFIKSIKRIRD